jgi:hypothetical protein
MLSLTRIVSGAQIRRRKTQRPAAAAPAAPEEKRHVIRAGRGDGRAEEALVLAEVVREHYVVVVIQTAFQGYLARHAQQQR